MVGQSYPAGDNGYEWQRGDWAGFKAKRGVGLIREEFSKLLTHDIDSSKPTFARSRLRNLRPTYTLSKLGEQCPSGTVEVETEDECVEAALRFGKWVPKNPTRQPDLSGDQVSHHWESNTWTDCRKGCFVTAHSNGKFHWNKATTLNMRHDERRVCKTPLGGS